MTRINLPEQIEKETVVTAQLRAWLTYQDHCPTRREIENYYLGELSDVQEDAIAHHLADGCNRCQATVANVMLEFERFAPEPDQQPGVLERVIGAMKRRVETLVAELVPLPEPLLALRGDSARSMIFQASSQDGTNLEIRLDIQPDLQSDRRVVVGQIKTTGQGLDGWQVQLLQDEKVIAEAIVDGRRGRFHLPPVVPGLYRLAFSHVQMEIFLPSVPCL